jgi:hypothetical protein
VTFRLTRPEPTEQQVMQAVRTALQWHPQVRALFRVNSGAHVVPGERRRFIRYHDIEGCSDLIGILSGGRWLAVEVKRPSTKAKATPQQAAFLDRVRSAGGVAFVAWDAEQARRELDEALAVAEAV